MCATESVMYPILLDLLYLITVQHLFLSALGKRESHRKSPGHGVSPLVTSSGATCSSSKVDTARRHIASELLQNGEELCGDTQHCHKGQQFID